MHCIESREKMISVVRKIHILPLFAWTQKVNWLIDIAYWQINTETIRQ